MLQLLLQKAVYWFGLWQFFMVIEDSLLHIFSCSPYPPPVIAMHLHRPHSLNCLLSESVENSMLPRVGLSDRLLAIEPLNSVFHMAIQLGIPGLVNFAIIGLMLFFSFTIYKKKGGPKRVVIVVILALVSVLIGETFGTPYVFS